MQIADQQTRSLEQITRLGSEILRKQIEPSLPPADTGKFVAIDVDRGEFEVHEDDYIAVTRLLARFPGAVTFLGRVGSATTCRIGLR